MADDTLWPVELTCTVHHLTLSLSLTYRPSEEVFVLKINGIEYNHYEFKAIAFNEVESGRNIKGYMHVNHQSIFDRMMPVPFSGDNMRALVEEVLFDEAVESIQVGKLDCSVETGRFLFDFVANYGSLKELSFKQFH